MKWIVGASKDVAVDKGQMLARKEYIRNVTSSDVSEWYSVQVKERSFLYCDSADGVNGTFITAHDSDVFMLCQIPAVFRSEFVVANTCLVEKLRQKVLLFQMKRFNGNAKLCFAEQELSVTAGGLFWQSTTLNDVGQFGFQTSLSERKLFRKRNKGFEQAICESFIWVSPIICAGDY